MVPDHRSSIPYYPHEGIYPPRTSTANRRDSSNNSSEDSRLWRGRGHSNERGRPPERERYPSSDRRLQGEEDYPVMEDPQIDMKEDHLMMEDPLMEEDLLMMEDPQDAQIEEDPKDLEALLDL